MSVNLGVIFGFLCFVFQWAEAVDEPVIPVPGEDLVLTNGIPIKDFFDNRANDSVCRAALDKTRVEYSEINKQLRAAIQKADLPEHLEHLDAKHSVLKKRLIEQVFRCGECQARAVERREIEMPGGTQIWFVADGSCSLHGTGSQERYSRSREFLNGILNYPQYKSGFSQVLQYVSVDSADGSILWENNDLKKSSDIFISVLAPVFDGAIASLSYFFGSVISETVSALRREYSIQFNAKRPPAGFKRPPVYFSPAAGMVSGKFDQYKKKSLQWNLRRVKGSWFIHDDGYIRYFTAGDFGELFEGTFGLGDLLGADTAQAVLSSTLFDMTQIARGEH